MRDFKDLKIAVAGTGYVGLSIATLLSQHHKVTAVDIVPEKVELINNKKSPIQDEYIEKYLAEKELDLTATLDAKEAYSDADFVVIAAPTNYDSKKNFFDTSAVEAVIKLVIEYNPEAIMVIKSTIPVANDNGENPLMDKARAYVENWKEAYKSNIGLLLFGDVGTGKSFFAGCIANALLDQDVPVLMTNFPIILNRLTGMFSEDRSEFIARAS